MSDNHLSVASGAKFVVDGADRKKLVIKDNALIMASYSLTVEEQRLILACIQKAHTKKIPRTNNSLEIVLTVREYAELYDVKMVTAYKALSNSADKLYDRTIRIAEEGVKKRNARWIQEHAEYDSGRIKLIFSDLVSQHITEVVTAQTAYMIAQASQLRSLHSIRLFEIFQTVIDHEERQGCWEVSVDELKEILDVNKNYDRWADFKRKVIDPSLKAINKDTSLKVEWRISKKDGRKISHIEFTVFELDQLTLGLE